MRMRQDDDLGTCQQDQLAEIGQQIVPGRQAVGIAGQAQAVELAERTDIGEIGLTGRHHLARVRLHGRQLQAEITQLHAALGRHPTPRRHGLAIPGAQAALQARRSYSVEAHAAVMLGFDLAGGQGHDPGLASLAVEAEGGQLGVVGMRSDDHHPPLTVVGMARTPQGRFADQPAMPAAQANPALAQRPGQSRQVQVAQAVHPTFESLGIGLRATFQQHRGFEEAPQPASAHADAKHQRIAFAQLTVDSQTAIRQAYRQRLDPFRETVAVVLARRIEQVIGEPGFVGDPQGHEEDRQQPGADQQTDGQQCQQRNQ